MGLKSLTPQDFAARHVELLKASIQPLADKVGAKAVADKLIDAARTAERDDPKLAIVYDNMRDVHELSGRRSLPLKDLYSMDERVVLDAATAAAKTTGGKLTPLSARLLPHDLRADYAAITGMKIDDKVGAARDGVSIKKTGKNVDIKIDFEKALAGETARSVVLGITDHVVIKADRLDHVTDPSLPPYWIVITPREGKLEGEIRTDSGTSGFSDPDHGHLIFAGTSKHELLKDYNSNKPFSTMTFTLDKVNDLGSPDDTKPTSEKTKAVRESWGRFFKESDGYFDLEKGVASGKLEARTLAEAREFPGAKTLFKQMRDDSSQSISALVRNGVLSFAYDPKTNSLAALKITEGEVEAWLCILDGNRKKWVGTYEIDADSALNFHER